MAHNLLYDGMDSFRGTCGLLFKGVTPKLLSRLWLMSGGFLPIQKPHSISSAFTLGDGQASSRQSSNMEIILGADSLVFHTYTGCQESCPKQPVGWGERNEPHLWPL